MGGPLAPFQDAALVLSEEEEEEEEAILLPHVLPLSSHHGLDGAGQDSLADSRTRKDGLEPLPFAESAGAVGQLEGLAVADEEGSHARNRGEKSEDEDDRPRFRLQNRLVPSLFAAAKSMGDVVLKPMDHDTSQMWMKEEVEAGKFVLLNAALLDRALCSSDSNSPVKLKLNVKGSADPSCIWIQGEEEAEGFTSFKPLSDSTQCLDALDANVIHGVSLATHTYKKGPHQQWKLRPWAERYTIRPKCAPMLGLAADPVDQFASVSLKHIDEDDWDMIWDAKIAKDGGLVFTNAGNGLILCSSTSLGGQVCCSNEADMEERGKWTLGKDEGGCYFAIRPFAVASQNMECQSRDPVEGNSVTTGPWIGDGGPHQMWSFFAVGAEQPSYLTASRPSKGHILQKVADALDISKLLPTNLLRRKSKD